MEDTFDDWSWDVKEDIWMEHFEALKEYYQEFKTSRVKYTTIYKNLNLAKWTGHQRTNYKVGNYHGTKLSKKRIDLLEQTFPDWSWNIFESVDG